MKESNEMRLLSLRSEITEAMSKCSNYPDSSTNNRELWNAFSSICEVLDDVLRSE